MKPDETKKPDDVIHVNVTVSPSFADRLRMLFGCPLHVHVKTPVWFMRGGTMIFAPTSEVTAGAATFFARHPSSISSRKE